MIHLCKLDVVSVKYLGRLRLDHIGSTKPQPSKKNLIKDLNTLPMSSLYIIKVLSKIIAPVQN